LTGKIVWGVFDKGKRKTLSLRREESGKVRAQTGAHHRKKKKTRGKGIKNSSFREVGHLIVEKKKRKKEREKRRGLKSGCRGDKETFLQEVGRNRGGGMDRN